MRMKHAWKVVLLGATLFACAAARAQDESCAVDREFLKGLLGIPSVTADKAKTDEAVAFVRARLESHGVVCAEERMLFLSLWPAMAREPTRAELYQRCHEMGDVILDKLG